MERNAANFTKVKLVVGPYGGTSMSTTVLHQVETIEGKTAELLADLADETPGTDTIVYRLGDAPLVKISYSEIRDNEYQVDVTFSGDVANNSDINLELICTNVGEDVHLSGSFGGATIVDTRLELLERDPDSAVRDWTGSLPNLDLTVLQSLPVHGSFW